MGSILKDIWSKDRKRFIRVLFLHIVVGLLSSISIVMLVPLLELVNIDVSGGKWAWLLQPYGELNIYARAAILISLFIGLMLLRSLLQRISTIEQTKFLETYEFNLRRSVYDNVFGADYEQLSGMRSSELINLVVAQCRQCKSCLQLTMSFFASLVTALTHLAIACFISLPLTILVLVVGVGFLYLFRPFQKKSREYGEKSIAAQREMYKEIQNQFGAVKEIRAYGVEEDHRERFDKVTSETKNINIKLARLRAVPQFCYSVAVSVMLAVAFVVSVFALDIGSGQLVMLVYIFSRLWPMFSSWQGQLQSIQSCVPAWEKIKGTIDKFSSEFKEITTSGDRMSFSKEIRFDKVRFSYRGHEAVVLNGVSFSLPHGSMTALVGLSGAGKSTTADLLMGLLRPTEGQILADDTPLCNENIAAWRKSVGYVPQDPFVLNGTIRENLLRFHPGATEEEMISALKRSMAWGFVEKTELGLDTVIGDKGVGLSGGERQRLVFARVLMGNPSLIILDEATSALDYESESAIRETLQNIRGEATILIIAHRLSTIKGADRVIVLEDGRVSECDDIDNLLERNDSYLKRMLLAE